MRIVSKKIKKEKRFYFLNQPIMSVLKYPTPIKATKSTTPTIAAIGMPVCEEPELASDLETS